MTDIPASAFTTSGQFTIASLVPPPQYLTIGPYVRISLDDGSIEYGDGYQPDEAARTFWEAMSAAYGGPEAVFGHGLAARIDAEMAGLRQRAEKAEAELARVRRYCELTADSCHVPTRQTAIDILQLLDQPAPETT